MKMERKQYDAPWAQTVRLQCASIMEKYNTGSAGEGEDVGAKPGVFDPDDEAGDDPAWDDGGSGA